MSRPRFAISLTPSPGPSQCPQWLLRPCPGPPPTQGPAPMCCGAQHTQPGALPAPHRNNHPYRRPPSSSHTHSLGVAGSGCPQPPHGPPVDRHHLVPSPQTGPSRRALRGRCEGPGRASHPGAVTLKLCARGWRGFRPAQVPVCGQRGAPGGATGLCHQRPVDPIRESSWYYSQR